MRFITKTALTSAAFLATVLLGTLLTYGKDTVPYFGKTDGQVAYPHYPDMSYVTIQEVLTGTHIGKFTMKGETGLWGTLNQ